MATPLATPSDVEAVWRSLSAEETSLADALLRVASRVVRARYSDVDARITAGTLDAQDVADIVALMVKRSMVSPVGDGVEQQSQTAGPFSISNKYANAEGNIYLTAEERLLFEPTGYGSRAVVGWLA